MMTTNVDNIPAAILKDVVAYVDVWSSSKTENYCKPFIQQLQEMGAEVSKTFNKQVTHVVFKNGHQATWNKAKKNGVRLVSVLWVARCKDDGEHVDEELCPALNDEVNPALKKKAHRCMQPRDSPERTPDSDKRMKKKLDKMMKDLLPKSPLITDVSPFIIDEENGIVYSPSLKRSDSMAQRLKIMREKRENLSPTASQMVESRLSPELKPSLGSTPTLPFLHRFDSESDDDFSPSDNLVRSVKRHTEEQHKDKGNSSVMKYLPKTDSQKPWLSPCRDVPAVYSSLPGLSAKARETKEAKRPRRTSVKNDPVKKHISLNSSPVDYSPEASNGRQSVLESESSGVRKNLRSSSASKELKSSLSNSKSIQTIKSFFESKLSANTCLEIGGNSGCSATSSSAPDSAVPQNIAKNISPWLLKGSKQRSKRTQGSLSARAQSSAVLGDSPISVTPSTKDEEEDDGVFDDYFSPANQPQSQRQTLLRHSLSMVRIPFELESSPGKKRRRSSVTTGSTLAQVKRRKQDEKPGAKKDPQPVGVSSVLDHQMPLNKNAKEITCSTGNNNIKTALVKKHNRQSTLSFTHINELTTESVTNPPPKPSENLAGQELDDHRSSDHLGSM